MKTLHKKINRFILFCMAFALIALSACKKDDVASLPVITSIRNYAAAPNDTLVTSIIPGQWIVIHGQNLKNAVEILFDGVSASFNYALFTNDMAVVQIPSTIPFNDVAADELNTVKYTTTSGTTTFNFSVKTLPATITGNSLSSKNVVGDSVHIYGTNLYLIESVTIAGDAIPPFKTASNGSSIGFKLPAIAQTMPWHVEVVAASGTYTFDISIVPTISDVSNANPSQGDSVYIYGKNLNGVQIFTFAGTNITSFKESADGSSVGFVAPASNSYSSGPVTIVSNYGTAATPYKVNTQNGVTEGLLADFEWGDNFGYAWWGDITLVSNIADFNGILGTNSSQYVYFNSPVLDGGASVYAPLGNSNTGNHWVPVANISDPVQNWGLQFEMSVAHPWNGGTLYIRTEFAGDSYVARYEPWKIPGSNTTVDFKTKGWQTVTIPLTDFRSKVNTLGDGESITQLNQLLGSTGATSYNMTLKNFGTSPTATGFYAAIDNIRVVKIK